MAHMHLQCQAETTLTYLCLMEFPTFIIVPTNLEFSNLQFHLNFKRTFDIQTMHNSDLVLHCLSMSHNKKAMSKCVDAVKTTFSSPVPSH